MFEQVAPDASQSCHWYAYDEGLLVHDPLEVESDWPSVACPVTGGAAEADGGGGGATEAVADDVAEPDPAELVAVTTTRIVWPMSATASVYVLWVAPLMFEQLAPEPSQSCHW